MLDQQEHRMMCIYYNDFFFKTNPGFLEPTAGNAMVGGYDIRRNLTKVRESLGLCPQHDILFDSLTVEEHLKFFGRVALSFCVETVLDLWSFCLYQD